MLINFIDLMGFGLVVLLLTFDALKFQASTMQIMYLSMVYSFCAFIGSPILGAWSDRIGRRPVLIFSQWGSVAGYLILALAMSRQWETPSMGLGLLFLSRIVAGFTAGNITVTNAYISDVIPPKDRAGVMGLLGAAFGVGFTLGPPIGGLLGHFHPTFPGLGAALLSAIASVMVIKYLPESHPTEARDAPRLRPSSSGFAFSPTKLAAFAAQPAAVRITSVWFLCMVAYVMVEQSLSLVLADRFGFDKLHAGLVYGCVGLVIALVQGGAIRPLGKRFSEWSMALAGSVVAIVGLMLYAQVAVTPILWLLGIAALCNAVGRSLQTPTLSAMLSQNSDPNAQGAAFGVYQGSASLARVIGPPIAGVLYVARPANVFLIAAGFVAVGTVLLVLLRPRLRATLPRGFEVVASAAES